MAGFKRGGARGGGIKKAFTKKRSSPEDDDNAPCATKKAKGDEEDDSLPVVPELKTDDNGDTYVGVSCAIGYRLQKREKIRVLTRRLVKHQRQATCHCQRLQQEHTCQHPRILCYGCRRDEAWKEGIKRHTFFEYGWLLTNTGHLPYHRSIQYPTRCCPTYRNRPRKEGYKGRAARL